MKVSEIRAKSDDEIRELILDMRRKQFNLRMQAGAGQPPRSSEVRQLRKDVARAKTILKERQQGNAA